MQVGLGPGQIVLDGDPAPLLQRGTAPNFRPMSVVAKWLDGSRCHLIPRSTSAQATLCWMETQLHPYKGRSPQFSAHVCCGQMVRWIQMPLGTEVGLVPGHIVLDGDPAQPLPSQIGGAASQFLTHVCCGQTARWIKMPLCTKVGLVPGHIVRWGPAPPPQKTGIRPMSVVAKRSPISATAKHF